MHLMQPKNFNIIPVGQQLLEQGHLVLSIDQDLYLMPIWMTANKIKQK